MWPLQRLLSDKRQNSHSLCLVTQNRQYQLYWLMCNWLSGFGFGLDIGVHHFIFSDMDWMWSRWKSFGLDQVCKISISVHHWPIGYKTLSYSARLSSSSVKHHNFFKTKVLQPKVARNIFGLLCILPEKLNSMHQEICELIVF